MWLRKYIWIWRKNHLFANNSIKFLSFSRSISFTDATDDLRVSRLKSDDAEDGEVFFFGWG